MAGSSQIEKRLQDLEARLSEVQEDLEQKTDALEDLRDELGTAIADGTSKKRREELQTEIRQLSDEVDGLERAVPLLEETIRGTRSDLEETRAREAAAEAEERVEEALELVEELRAELAVFLEDWLLLAERAEAATSAAWQAERRAAELNGRRTPSASRVLQDGWWKAAGLQVALEKARVFKLGGEVEHRRRQREKQKAAAAN